MNTFSRRRPVTLATSLVAVGALAQSCLVDFDGYKDRSVSGEHPAGASGGTAGTAGANSGGGGGAPGGNTGGGSGGGAGSAGSGGSGAGGSAGSSGGGSGGTAGSGGSGGTAGNGGLAGSGGSAGTIGGGAGGSAGSGGTGETCSDLWLANALAPVDSYIMLDLSDVMTVDATWDNVKFDLSNLFERSEMEGNGVALGAFASATCTALQPSVLTGTVPSAAPTLRAELESWTPGGSSDWEGALRGLVDYTRTRSLLVPGRMQVGIFVTRSSPSVCMDDIDSLASIVSDHYESTRIPTYTVYLNGGGVMSEVTEIASGAGREGFDFPRYASNAEDGFFESVLADIHGLASVMPCVFEIPDVSGVVDSDTTTVTLVPSTGADLALPRLAYDGECGVGDGWHYDDDTNPTRILLCPATCDPTLGDVTRSLRANICSTAD